MSLEQSIAALTSALAEQTSVLKGLHELQEIMLNKHSIGGQEIPPSEPVKKAEAKAQPKKEAPAPKPETKPATKAKEEPVEEELEDDDSLDASIEPLPEGTRDQAFYVKHVQPVLLSLREVSDRETLAAFLEDFGAKKASDIPSDKWDLVVHLAKSQILELTV